MCLKRETPCEYGECPFCAEYSGDCEYWCGADEPEDNFEENPLTDSEEVL